MSGVGERNACTLLVECKIVQLLWKTVCKNLNMKCLNPQQFQFWAYTARVRKQAVKMFVLSAHLAYSQ